MNVGLRKSLIVHGRGALTRPLRDFVEDLQNHFPRPLQVVDYTESGDGWNWSIRCILLSVERDALTEIKEYLQIYFPSDDGNLEIDGEIEPLFEVVPGLFFVRNVSDAESTKVEIHLVDRFGRTKQCHSVNASDDNIVVDGAPVPRAVVTTGLLQDVGTGDFVDSNGRQVLPRDIGDF
mgnify:CR=1 FL=1